MSGNLSATVDFLLLLSLAEVLGLNYLFANAIAFIFSCLINFGVNKYWVFKAGYSQTGVQLMVFMKLCSLGLLINRAVMWLLTKHAHFYYLLAKLIAMALLVPANDAVKRKVVFS